ncbi:MAG: PIG-L family deacetylase [Phycisphaerales bacterium]|nr:PIG-L family deacetylase [Phycisphaerales bacterium]
MSLSVHSQLGPPGYFARHRRQRLLAQMRMLPGLDDYSKRAIVFSPHQDDEVLGCGGTIIKKIEEGADVHIVFMTNGRRSHAGHMEIDALIEMRRSEAINAAAILGVAEDRVTILDLPDGKLGEHKESAVASVGALLERIRPEEVFVPSRYDGPDDHLATYQFVVDALRKTHQSPRMVEYAVWFWHYWPWVNSDERIVKSTLRAFLNALMRPIRMRREFNACVDISACRDRKLAALAAHESQVKRLMPECDWPILSDISNGAWLAACTQDIEIFSVCESDCIPR